MGRPFIKTEPPVLRELMTGVCLAPGARELGSAQRRTAACFALVAMAVGALVTAANFIVPPIGPSTDLRGNETSTGLEKTD